MLKYPLTASLLAIAAVAFTQDNNPDYKYGLKLYNLTSYEVNSKSLIIDDSIGLSSEYTEKLLQVLHPTIAFQWKSKKSNFHEVELTSLMLGKLDTKMDIIDSSTNTNQTAYGDNIWVLNVSMRYEFILNFNKSNESKLVPSIGFGANPYYKQNRSVPKTADLFPTSDTYLGLRGFVTPRLTYNMTSRLFLDLNLPFCVIDLQIHSSERADPTLPVEERKVSTLNFRQFPSYFSGRIGIGLRL